MEASPQFDQDLLGRQSPLTTGILQRLAAATAVDPQLLKHAQCFWMLNDPVGDGGVEVALGHGELADLRNECPVFRPATNRTSATAPRKNTVSPGTRSQRRVCMTSVCMNSGLRAYQ